MPEYKTLLFEIGTEELPPKSLNRLAAALQKELLAQMEKSGLVQAGAGSKVFATPRRLAVSVDAVAEKQPDQVLDRRGPALQAAFDKNGEATQAALGFARSVGKPVEELERQKTGKGEWLFCQVHQPGKTARELLPGMIDTVLKTLPIAKRMRWADLDAEFIRPVHWLVLLYGDEVIDAEILTVKTGRTTRGHRFHAPGLIELGHADEYEDSLASKGCVTADFYKRRQVITDGVMKLAGQAGGAAVVDPDLLDEVTGIVERAVPLKGNIDPEFMDLPQEVLVSSMQDHQKYFPVVNDESQLLPVFITVSNIQSTDESRVIHGNERVLRARLSDARFFWDQDKATPLGERFEALENVLFHKKLGSLADKARRINALGSTLAVQLGAAPDTVKRVAELCKADLLTDMVGEFPELQGVMGKYYALNDNEPVEVARAIEEHYLPRFAGDEIPASLAGKIIAIADKLDTICGVFAAGETPSGDKDPYGLRRAALGVLRILIEAGLELDLRAAIGQALAGFASHDLDNNCQDDVYHFVFERLRQYYQSQGYGARLYQAVAAISPGSPLDFDRRLKALSGFAELESAPSLIEANKRISNILSKTSANTERIDEARLQQVQEIELYNRLNSAIEQAAPLLEKGDYPAILAALAQLKQPVDAFFDNVMVMDEDAGIRDNRIALLGQVNRLFGRVADISCLR